MGTRRRSSSRAISNEQSTVGSSRTPACFKCRLETTSPTRKKLPDRRIIVAVRDVVRGRSTLDQFQDFSRHILVSHSSSALLQGLQNGLHRREPRRRSRPHLAF